MSIKNVVAIPWFSSYFVCKQGKVYSQKSGNRKELTKCLTKHGYHKIALRSDSGETKHFQVHRLIAQSFIENPTDFPIVNHKNGNKTDNRASNLEWTDAKGNAQHYQKKLRPKKQKLPLLGTPERKKMIDDMQLEKDNEDEILLRILHHVEFLYRDHTLLETHLGRVYLALATSKRTHKLELER